MEAQIWRRLLENLLLRILGCLPTFMLFRFKSVCKRWNQLISSSNTFPPNLPVSSTPAFLVCWSHWQASLTKFLAIGGADDGPPTSRLSALSFDFLPPDLISIKMVAACKSLLCCSCDQQPTHLYISNPATRTFTRLPPPHQLTAWDFIAMAFDSTARRCNLLIGAKYMNQCHLNTVFEMYDSHTNSWTKSQVTTRSYVKPRGEGIYSKGIYYWINETHIGYTESRHDVVGFNAETGRWDVIWHPHTLYCPSGHLQCWELSGCDGRVVLVFKKDLSFWKLNEDDENGDYDSKRSKWSALPMRCLSDGSDEDLRRRISAQVVANCSGWVLVYFPNKKMMVLDGEGRIASKIEGEELNMLAESDGCPTWVHAFEVNNVWWPSPPCA